VKLLVPIVFYASAAFFVAGIIWRLWTWLRAPMPLTIVLTPAPVTAGGVARRLTGEVFLFRSLFRADRRSWSSAWLFHVALALLLVGHIGGLVTPGFAQVLLGLGAEQFHRVAVITGGAVGILAEASLLILLIRRVTAERLRYISNLADYVALALLLLVLTTGNYLRFTGTLDLAQAREFVSGLLALRPVALPAAPVLTVHLLLVCALLACIPFSKLAHGAGLALNPTLNQKNDPRGTENPKSEIRDPKEIRKPSSEQGSR